MKMQTVPLCTLRGHAGNSVSSVCFINEYKLASCESKSGTLILWDLERFRVLQRIQGDGSGGLYVGKIQSEHECLLYQQRDKISLYDVNDMQVTKRMNTNAVGFCKATICDSYVFFPSQPSNAPLEIKIWDAFIDPLASSIVTFTVVESSPNTKATSKLGMMTSLSVLERGKSLYVMCCGMESGDIFLTTFTLNSVEQQRLRTITCIHRCSISVGTEPVLCIDLAVSASSSIDDFGNSVVGIAGIAGDAAEVANKKDQGTIFIFNLSSPSDFSDAILCKIRKRLETCPIGDPTLSGKPGVGCCTFRSDGKLFAVGGWDKRTRIFSRGGKLLRIMKGHNNSIVDMEWQPTRRLCYKDQFMTQPSRLVTAGGDGRICFWDVEL